jgi:MYXO-CTERM domain-containing protein
MVFNGLALYLLNVAADQPAAHSPQPAGLPSDRDSVFVDRGQARFAAVRRGDVWFAVHARRDPPDLRYDSGLIAGKWRSPSGRWVDFVAPRPFVLDAGETAGPVILRGSRTLHPAEGPISVARGGTVTAGSVRFRPESRGVTVSLSARRGDTVAYTTYGPAATSSPPGRTRVVRKHLASCCALDLTERRISVPVRRSATVSFRLGVAAPAPRHASSSGGGSLWWTVPAVVALALAAFALSRRRRPIKPL